MFLVQQKPYYAIFNYRNDNNGPIFITFAIMIPHNNFPPYSESRSRFMNEMWRTWLNMHSTFFFTAK